VSFADGLGTGVRRRLLAEERVVRPLGGEPLAQCPFDGLVGVGDVRAVGLLRHVQVGGTETLEADRVGGVGEGAGEVQVGAEVHVAQPTVATRRRPLLPRAG
jgi:hypothetical protein